MSRSFCLVLAALALSTPAAFAQRGRMSDQAAARYGWLSSLSEGKQRARQAGKPLMVVMRCVP